MLEALSRGLTQKMLHGTLAELNAADGEQRAQLAQTVSRLFLRQSARPPADDSVSGAHDRRCRRAVPSAPRRRRGADPAAEPA